MNKINKIDLFLQKEIQKPKNTLLKELYERKNFSNEELLYLFPNNKLKRNGLPLKKGGSKKKKKIRKMLRNQHLFNIIEDTIDNILGHQSQNEFFNKFVDFNGLYSEKSNIFCYE